MRRRHRRSVEESVSATAQGREDTGSWRAKVHTGFTKVRKSSEIVCAVSGGYGKNTGLAVTARIGWRHIVVLRYEVVVGAVAGDGDEKHAVLLCPSYFIEHSLAGSAHPPTVVDDLDVCAACCSESLPGLNRKLYGLDRIRQKPTVVGVEPLDGHEFSIPISTGHALTIVANRTYDPSH